MGLGCAARVAPGDKSLVFTLFNKGFLDVALLGTVWFVSGVSGVPAGHGEVTQVCPFCTFPVI